MNETLPNNQEAQNSSKDINFETSTPEAERERRTFRGLVGIGLAAGSLFLGACARNGVEHRDPKAEILVVCDVLDINNLPRAEVSLDGGDYGVGRSESRVITHGEETTRIDTIQAFDISCVERRPDGVIVSQSIPQIDIGVPGDPFRDDLQFWQLDSDPALASRVNELRKVSYVLTVKPDDLAAEGFSVSSLQLFDSYVVASPGSSEATDNGVNVDFSRLDHPNSVRIRSVTVSDGPGLGQFGDVPMHNGVVQNYS